MITQAGVLVRLDAAAASLVERVVPYVALYVTVDVLGPGVANRVLNGLSKVRRRPLRMHMPCAWRYAMCMVHEAAHAMWCNRPNDGDTNKRASGGPFLGPFLRSWCRGSSHLSPSIWWGSRSV